MDLMYLMDIIKKTPTIITKNELYKIWNLIENVLILLMRLHKQKIGYYVYLDPPYIPINKKFFVGYINNRFSLEIHLKLFKKGI